MKRKTLTAVLLSIMLSQTCPISCLAEAETTADAEAAERYENTSDTGANKDYVTLYCSNTAREAVDEEELTHTVDLIASHAAPQAINLILKSFPVFREAGRDAFTDEIGLYVYYGEGDKDTFSHYAFSDIEASAFPMTLQSDEDGSFVLGNIIQINLEYFLEKEEGGRLYADISSPLWTDLEYVLVHEFMHAFMTDYNRAGMLGYSDPETYFADGDENFKVKHNDFYQMLKFPGWFLEGTPSTLDRFYSRNRDYFSSWSARKTDSGQFIYTVDSVLSQFAEGSREFLLTNGRTTGQFITGPLACLYLYELTARGDDSIGSAFYTDEEDNLQIDTGKLLLGFNRILESLHNGESLDELIARVSNGAYRDAEDFETRFIRGSAGKFSKKTGDQAGSLSPGRFDKDSVEFCVTLLNYLEDIAAKTGRCPSGSILYAFEYDGDGPFDSSLEAKADLFRFCGSNDFVISSAKIDIPYSDGGRSICGADVPSAREMEALAEEEASAELEEISEFDWQGADYDEALEKFLSMKYYMSNMEPVLSLISVRDDFKDLLLEASDSKTAFYIAIRNAGYDPYEEYDLYEEYGSYEEYEPFNTESGMEQ